MRLISLALVAFGFSSLALAQPQKIGPHLHIASCVGEAEGFAPDKKLKAEFEFYQELNLKDEVPTGYGFAIQKITGENGSMQFVLPLEMASSKDSLQITMFVAMDPNQVVSVFAMPKEPEFILNLAFFGQKIGEFQCKSQWFELTEGL